jgi:hypothetical protein
MDLFPVQYSAAALKKSLPRVQLLARLDIDVERLLRRQMFFSRPRKNRVFSMFFSFEKRALAFY